MIEEKEEIWKTIPEFPNYKVSNMGRVKSLNYNRTRKEKLLRFSKDKYGYLRVTISKEGVNSHSILGMYVKNKDTNKVIYKKNENKLLTPASSQASM